MQKIRNKTFLGTIQRPIYSETDDVYSGATQMKWDTIGILRSIIHTENIALTIEISIH